MPDFGDIGEKNIDSDKGGKRLTFPGMGGDNFHKAIQQDERSNIQLQAALDAPPQITEPRCSTCQSPYRNHIERLLIKGHSYSSIARSIPPNEDGKKVDRRSISFHFEHHMALDDAATRAILEDEAKAVRQNYEEGFRGAITKRGVLEIALRKGYEDLLSGITTVEPKDLIKITEVLALMDSQSHDAGLDEARTQFALFTRAIQDVCDVDTQAKIAERVKELREHDDIDIAMEQVLAPKAITIESGDVEEV